MRAVRPIGLIAVLAASPMLWGQNIISARAGLIHYADGHVLLNEKQIVPKPAQFESLQDQDYLRTEHGRAEVLLTPGVFLRLAEASQIQMLSTRLTDVRLRLVDGSAVIEAAELNKDTAVTIEVGEAQARLEGRGLYHVFAGQENRLRVFQGEALVKTEQREYLVKGKREIELAGDFETRKFDPEDTDPLDRWSKRRATYLSMANVSASRIAYSRGLSFASSGWFFNPYYGMYTFLPLSGIAWSPYGLGYFSPRAAYAIYVPPTRNAAAYGGRGPAINNAGGFRSAMPGGSSGVLSGGARSAGGSVTMAPGGLGGGGVRGGGSGGGGISRGGARR